MITVWERGREAEEVNDILPTCAEVRVIMLREAFAMFVCGWLALLNLYKGADETNTDRDGNGNMDTEKTVNKGRDKIERVVKVRYRRVVMGLDD